MQLFLYRKSRNALLGSSRVASVPALRFRRSEKIPSSNFLEFFTGRPKAWNRKARHRTISVPEMWKRLLLKGDSVLAVGLALGGARCRRHWALTRERRIHNRRSAEGSGESAGRAASRLAPRGGSILLVTGEQDRPCVLQIPPTTYDYPLAAGRLAHRAGGFVELQLIA